MKYVKMLGLLAVAAAALMAFAGVASATTVTAPAGTYYTSTISAERDASKSLTLHGIADVTCNKSSVGGKVESHGTGVTAEGKISTLTFTECDHHVQVLKPGSLTVHGIGSGKGTLTSSGAEITVEFTTEAFGDVHCVFATNNTHLGTVIPAASSTGHAKLEIESATIPRIGPFICGSAQWTGSYKVTTPTGLSIDQ
jgi:hypothetical protein